MTDSKRPKYTVEAMYEDESSGDDDDSVGLPAMEEPPPPVAVAVVKPVKIEKTEQEFLTEILQDITKKMSREKASDMAEVVRKLSKKIPIGVRFPSTDEVYFLMQPILESKPSSRSGGSKGPSKPRPKSSVSKFLEIAKTHRADLIHLFHDPESFKSSFVVWGMDVLPPTTDGYIQAWFDGHCANCAFRTNIGEELVWCEECEEPIHKRCIKEINRESQDELDGKRVVKDIVYICDRCLHERAGEFKTTPDGIIALEVDPKLTDANGRIISEVFLLMSGYDIDARDDAALEQEVTSFLLETLGKLHGWMRQPDVLPPYIKQDVLAFRDEWLQNFSGGTRIGLDGESIEDVVQPDPEWLQYMVYLIMDVMSIKEQLDVYYDSKRENEPIAKVVKELIGSGKMTLVPDETVDSTIKRLEVIVAQLNSATAITERLQESSKLAKSEIVAGLRERISELNLKSGRMSNIRDFTKNKEEFAKLYAEVAKKLKLDVSSGAAETLRVKMLKADEAVMLVEPPKVNLKPQTEYEPVFDGNNKRIVRVEKEEEEEELITTKTVTTVPVKRKVDLVKVDARPLGVRISELGAQIRVVYTNLAASGPTMAQFKDHVPSLQATARLIRGAFPNKKVSEIIAEANSYPADKSKEYTIAFRLSKMLASVGGKQEDVEPALAVSNTKDYGSFIRATLGGTANDVSTQLGIVVVVS